MKSILFSCLLLFLCISGKAQSVVTCITPSGSDAVVDACYDDLNAVITITGFDLSDQDVIFNGQPGTIISISSVTVTPLGAATAIPNGEDLTIEPTQSSPVDVEIHFLIELTDCDIYNVPACGVGLPPCIEFSTTSGGTSTYCAPFVGNISFDISVPTIDIHDNALPLGAFSQNGNDFLLNEIVDRYYWIEAVSGKVDFFTFSLDVEPDITILDLEIVHSDLSFYQSLASGLAPGSSFSTDITSSTILGYTVSDDFLSPGGTSRMLIHERIQIEFIEGGVNCPAFNEQLPTQYTVELHCDEISTNPPCYSSNFDLNLGGATMDVGWWLYIREDDTWPTNTFQEFLSLCPGETFNYTLHLENHLNNAMGLPPGSGTRRIDSITFPINTEYWTFDDILLDGIPVVFTTNGIQSTCQYFGIDFTQFTSDPDGAGTGLTNMLGNFAFPFFNLLPEGEHITLTLTNFHFIGNDAPDFHFQNCDAPHYGVTGSCGSPYFTVNGRVTCELNDPTAVAMRHFDEGYQAENLFTGYSVSTSSTTDIAPGNIFGLPETADFTYSYITTNGGWNPLQLAIRPYGGNSELLTCDDMHYSAVLIVPPALASNNAFFITGNQVTITDPLNGLFPAVVVTADDSNYPEIVIDLDGLGLTNPAAATLTFNVGMDCTDVGLPFGGSAIFTLQFRASCFADCPEVERVYGCGEIELFFHCPGGCDGPTIGIETFTFNRESFGWATENDFVINGAGPANPVLNRVYDCDLILASAEGGAGFMTAGSIFAMEIAYDPPAGGNQNFFILENGQFLFNGNPVPVLMDTWTVLPGRDAIRILADMSDPDAALAYTQNVTVEFTGHFRVTDPIILGPGFYIIQQVRGQFLELAADQSVTHESCDPWGDDMIFLRTRHNLGHQYILPGYASQDNGLGGSDQCLLRYLFQTSIDGGFPLADDFPGEYRPHFDFPDHIEFDVPAGYQVVSLSYTESTGALGPWNPLTTANSVEVNNFHANYPTFRTIDKSGRSRQALLLVMRRECPRQDPEISVLDLDLQRQSYNGDVICHDIAPIPALTAYNPANEAYSLNLNVPPITNGNTNPVTLNASITHAGATGVSLDNSWMYFEIVQGDVTSIVANGFGPDVGGLYHIDVVPNTWINGTIDIAYNCTHDLNPNVWDPIIINIHYGNACYGFPDLVNGALDPEPCLHLVETITINPQPSNISLDVTQIAIDGCGQVVMDVEAHSNGADVHNVFMTITPPAGFTLNPSLSDVEGVALTTFGPTWDIDAILTSFGETFFTNDVLYTDPLYNPLDFHLVYNVDCDVSGGIKSFQFFMEGISACAELVTQPLFTENVNYVPPSLNSPVITLTGPDDLSCDEPSVYNITISNIEATATGTLTVNACLPAGQFCLVNATPVWTTDFGNGCYEWIIPLTGATSYNIDINTITCATVICDDYTITANAEINGVYQCCPTCNACPYNFSLDDDVITTICCEPCVDAAFTVTEVSPCCYHFEDPTVTETAINGCPRWRLYDPFGNLVLVLYDVFEVDHCFDIPGTWVMCEDECCPVTNEVVTTCVDIIIPENCPCIMEAFFEATQLENCCWHFEDPTTVIGDCRRWDVYDAGMNIVFSTNTISFDYCFPPNQVYTVCLTDCCIDGHGGITYVTYCEEFSCCPFETAEFTWTANENCCYWFADVLPDDEVVDCREWTVDGVTVTEDIAYMMYCFETNGWHEVCYTDCCEDELGNIITSTVCHWIYIDCCQVPDDIEIDITVIDDCHMQFCALPVLMPMYCTEWFVNGISQGVLHTDDCFEYEFGCSGIFEICVRAYCCDTPDEYIEDCVSVEVQCEEECCDADFSWECSHDLCYVFTDLTPSPSPAGCESWSVNGAELPGGNVFTMCFSIPGLYEICHYDCCYDPTTGQYTYDQQCYMIEITACCCVPVDFTYTATECEVCVEPVWPANCINPGIVSWDYGDGSPITTDSCHTYTSSGTYQVVMLFQCPGELPVGITYEWIEVECGCCYPLDFTYTTDDCEVCVTPVWPVPCENPGTVFWDYGDGTALSYDSCHTYTASGSYQVVMLFQCPGELPVGITYQWIEVDCGCDCCLPDDLTVNVHEDCRVEVFAQFPHCTDHAALYWDMGDGSAFIYGEYAVYDYEESGAYTICLYAYCPGNDPVLIGCEDIEVVCPEDCPCKVTPAFNQIETSECTFQFYDLSGATPGYSIVAWSWNFSGFGTSSLQNPVFSFPGGGTYTVCLTVTASNGIKTCTRSICLNVSCGCPPVDDCPIAIEMNFEQKYDGDEPSCTFNFFSMVSGINDDCDVYYYWTFGDGTTSTLANPVHTFPGSGTYEVCLTVIADCKDFYCSETICKVLDVECVCTCEGVPEFSVNWVSECTYDIVYLENINPCWVINDIKWTVNGNDFSGTTTVNYTFPSPGTYVICVYLYLVREDGEKCELMHCEEVQITCEKMFKSLQQGAPHFGLSPNPAMDKVNVNFMDIPAGPVTIEIVDSYGNLAYKQSFALEAGNQKVTLNTEGLSSGFYSVTMRSGTINEALKLIIQK